MTLTNYIGDVGSGKTLLQTWMIVTDPLERPNFSNYKINIPRWKRLQLDEIFNYTDCSLGLDEGYLYLDCRMSGSNLSEYMSYMLFQSRKNKTDYNITAQLFGTIDLRFREMADFIILCRHNDNDFHYTIFKNSDTDPSVQKYTIFSEDAKEIWQYYDTDEKIPINPDIIGASANKKDLLPKINEIVDYLLSRAAPKEWSKPMIDAYCTRKEYPKQYAPLIYSEIKLKSVLD